MMSKLALAILIGTSATAGLATMPGVENETRARQHWILQCQGCHRPDATGTPQTTPSMAGIVGRFTQVEGGREYLGRVPGVATAALSDKDLAELLNWTLFRFDQGNLAIDFRPYSAAEIGKLRRKPLRTNASVVRQGLVDAMAGKKDK